MFLTAHSARLDHFSPWGSGKTCLRRGRVLGERGRDVLDRLGAAVGLDEQAGRAWQRLGELVDTGLLAVDDSEPV